MCGYAQNTVISKCIAEGIIAYVSGNTAFRNNIFLKNPCGSQYMFSSVSAANIENNIFLLAYCGYYENYQLVSNGSGNTFSHNLFITPNPVPSNNISIGNVCNINRDSIFMSQEGNLYNIAHNYHLRSTCIGKNAGTDGTDIGLYGTTTPKKDGEIPYNPHIQTKAIPASTNSQGNLDINIKVKAQEY